MCDEDTLQPAVRCLGGSGAGNDSSTVRGRQRANCRVVVHEAFWGSTQGSVPGRYRCWRVFDRLQADGRHRSRMTRPEVLEEGERCECNPIWTNLNWPSAIVSRTVRCWPARLRIVPAPTRYSLPPQGMPTTSGSSS